MGKAHQAPKRTYTRKRYISRHAIERMRERLTGTDVIHRPEQDLGNWLDRAVEDAIRGGNVTTVVERHNDEEAQLVEIDAHELKAGKKLYAVVKPDLRQAGFDDAIVTVLSESMVTRYRSTRWKIPDRINSPFRALSDDANLRKLVKRVGGTDADADKLAEDMATAVADEEQTMLPNAPAIPDASLETKRADSEGVSTQRLVEAWVKAGQSVEWVHEQVRAAEDEYRQAGNVLGLRLDPGDMEVGEKLAHWVRVGFRQEAMITVTKIGVETEDGPALYSVAFRGKPRATTD
jgi:hypothetical protein